MTYQLPEPSSDLVCSPNHVRAAFAAGLAHRRKVPDALKAAQPAPQVRIPLAKHQPCGCVICTCEDGERCNGCGAKHCGNHPVGVFASPVYAAPQVRMTDGDIADLYFSITHQRLERLASPDSWVHKFARAVEAHYKIGVKP